MYRNEEQRDFARGLRNQMTEAEKSLWRLLRAGQLDGHKFRRQVAMGPYVVDFVCLAQKLIVELDGPQHRESDAAEYDSRRDAWLHSIGYRVLRFENRKLDDDIRVVVDEIRAALASVASNEAPPPSPTLPSRGRGPEELKR